MNYTKVLSSLLAGLRGQRLFSTFKRKRNNTSWIQISILGIIILGLMGSRNQKLRQPFQNGYTNISQALVNKFQVNKNPFKTNFNIATEIAEELKPDILGTNKKDNM